MTKKTGHQPYDDPSQGASPATGRPSDEEARRIDPQPSTPTGAGVGFLRGGGEMGARMRELDWSTTKLGPIDTWPDSLRTAAGIMLGACSPVGIYWGADLTFLYNDALRDSIGVKYSRALGRPAREAFSETWDTFGPMLAAVLAGHGAAKAHDQMILLDRSGKLEEAWFDHSFSPIRCEDGSVGGVLHIAVETTGRVQAERTITESEERHRALFESVEEASCVIEVLFSDRGDAVDYRFLEVNPAFVKLAGLQDPVGKRFRELAPASEVPWLQAYARIALTGRPERFTHEARHLDARWYDAYALRIGRPEEHKVGVLFNDVTERKRAEAALHASEEKYRSLFESMSEGFVIGRMLYDDSGEPCDYQFVEVNAAYEQLTGLSREESLRKTIRQIIPSLEPQWIENHARVVESGEPIHWESYNEHTGKTYEIYSYLAGPGLFASVFADITEHKRAEEALRDSEEQLKRAHEIAHLGSWKLDLTTNELTWSDEVYRIFGLEPGEFGATYEAFLERVHPDDRAAVDEAYFGSVREDRDSYEIEHRVVRMGTGDTRWVHEKCEHVRNAEGRIVRSLGMVLDITDRRQAEQALRESEQQARWLARFPEENPNPVLRVSFDGTVLYRNRAAASVSGWRCEVGQPLPKGLVGGLVCQAVEGGRAIEQEVDLGGKDFWMAVTPVIEEHYVNIYGRDISQRKRVEEALRESEERRRVAEAVETERQRLLDVLETLPAMICLLTPDYHVAFANLSLRERCGDSNGRHCYEWRFGRTEPCEFCESYRVLRTARPHHWEITAPDNRVLDIYDFPFTDVDGSRMILEMALDITDRRQAQEALIQAERLTIAGRLATSLAHEVNNPIQAVVGCLDLAMEALGDNETANRFMDVAVEELLRASRIVQQMRDLGRRENVPRELSDVGELVEKVLILTRKQAQNNQVQVLWEQEDGLPPVPIVRDRIQQVFLNLVLNALDAMPKGGALCIRAAPTRDPAGVRISFVDTGVGIAPEQLTRIFEAFHSTKELGLGLGLYLSRDIVLQHRGWIDVESEEGQGATFTVWLPADGA